MPSALVLIIQVHPAIARVWRNERSVILEEERRGNLGNHANRCFCSFFLFVDAAIVLTRKSRILLADDTFNSAKFPSLLGSTHDCIVCEGMLVELATNNRPCCQWGFRELSGLS